jgi:hypothetical protein
MLDDTSVVALASVNPIIDGCLSVDIEADSDKEAIESIIGKKYDKTTKYFSEIPIPEAELREIQKADLRRQIRHLKQTLAETDFVVLKINEARIEDNTKLESELKAKYKDTIEERKAARAKINQLEEEIANLN